MNKFTSRTGKFDPISLIKYPKDNGEFIEVGQREEHPFDHDW